MTNELDLITRAKNGDKQAISVLVSTYNERIFNLALRILRNREDAEDVLQETFLTVLEKLNTFDGRSNFFTWIYRIATNASLMKLRKQKIVFYEFQDNKDINGHLEKDFVLDWSHDPLLSVQNKEVKKLLDEAIKKLPEIFRTVFVLRDIEQLSIKETSKILEISEENVKIRLRRARLFLRDKLASYFKESVV
jgi:RNA polymerase sigma-70 factor (ECF subfamily)